jgi:hypothetical protein
MKSQSFDDWIFADKPLNPDQENILKEAIATLAVESLSPLVQSFQQVEHTLRGAAMAAPAPGFTSRWQKRLAEKKARQQRLMVGLGALLALGSAAAIGLAIFIPMLDTVSLAQLANSLIASLILLAARLHTVRTLASYMLEGVPSAIPIALWVAIATSLSGFTLAWVYAMWRIMIPKGLKA